MDDGCFRSKNGYTVVQNGVTRDSSISLKAKGLFLLIQSYITMPNHNWKKEEFMNMVPEGRKAFDSAWNELKGKGFLHVHIYSDGKDLCREYELLDEPDTSAHTFYYNAKGELTKTLSAEGTETHINTEDSLVSQKGAVGKGAVGNGAVRKGTFGNGTVNNNNSLDNNALDNKDFNSNPSVSQIDGLPEAEEPVIIDSFELMDVTEKNMVRNYLEDCDGIDYKVSQDVKKAISVVKYISDWDMYINDGTELDRQAYILAVQCLCEMITAHRIYEYNGSRVSYANVIDQINSLFKLSGKKDLGLVISMCAEHFVRALKKSDIKNKKRYMKSILWTDMSSGEIDWLGFFHRSYHKNIE